MSVWWRAISPDLYLISSLKALALTKKNWWPQFTTELNVFVLTINFAKSKSISRINRAPTANCWAFTKKII